MLVRYAGPRNRWFVPRAMAPIPPPAEELNRLSSNHQVLTAGSNASPASAYVHGLALGEGRRRMNLRPSLVFAIICIFLPAGAAGAQWEVSAYSTGTRCSLSENSTPITKRKNTMLPVLTVLFL